MLDRNRSRSGLFDCAGRPMRAEWGGPTFHTSRKLARQSSNAAITPVSPGNASRSLNQLPLISIDVARRLAANVSIGRLIDATWRLALASPYERALTAIAAL